jgi:hypothetical protein
MKLNGIEICLQQINSEQIDGDFIIHNPVSKKIIQLNETSSFVWKMILELKDTNNNLTTSDIVLKILEVYDMSEAEKKDVFQDIERILNDFFSSNLLIKEV